MKCNKCPQNVLTVMRPDVACQGKCGTLIHWTRKYCTPCSDKLKKCEDCGK